MLFKKPMEVHEIKELIRSNISLKDFKERVQDIPSNSGDFRYFNSLVTACRKTGRSDILHYLMKLRYLDEEINNISNLTSAFLDNTLSMDNLKFISKSFDYASFTFVIYELIEINQTEEEVLAAKKAFQVFGYQKPETLKSLIEFSQEKKNVFMENFLWFLFEEVSPFAEFPSWVRDFGLKNPPEIQEYKHNLKFEEPLDAGDIINKLKQLGIEFEDEKQAKKHIKEKLEYGYKEDDVFTTVFNKKLFEELYYDENLFRWFGPDNPTELESLRMFDSYVYDYEDDTDQIKDWFSGFCNNCHLRIRRRVHSLRIPMPSGGWLGCYCSFKCLREGVKNLEYESKEFLLIVHAMVDILEDEIMTIGIQDRE
jgi:hypothetical protein